MKLERDAIDALKELGRKLPENSSLQLCVPGSGSGHVCHRFRVSGGCIHHSESHSDKDVLAGSGPLR
jgi:hypothetical protein